MSALPFLTPSLLARVVFGIILGAHVTCAAAPPLRAVVDQHIQQRWTAEKLQPAERADDAEFLRRVYLDLIGTIPTIAEARAFLENPSENKRGELVDDLLARPAFAAHQAEVWDQVLFGRNPPGFGTDKREGFVRFLRDQFEQNRSYQAWARDILRAEGTTVDDGAPMFYVQYKDHPEDATEAITQKFLGVQLQCARCHDHPFESWSQRDFYGMAAFFARLRVVNVGKKDNLNNYSIGETDKGEVLFTGPAADQEVGKKGEPIAPQFLGGELLEEPELPQDAKLVEKFPSGKAPAKPHFSRKDQLAEWITGDDNPYFARAVANRVWAQFMGRGFVHPVDNMSESNTPSHPELLSELARQLVEHDFDLKWYMRELVNSETYQLSSVGTATDLEDEALTANPTHFQRANTRPLSAEELIDSWKVAIGYDEIQKAAEGSKSKPNQDRYAPLGSGYLLRFFGQPNNGVGDFQGGMHEHLYFNNGGISKLLSVSKGGLYSRLWESEDPLEARVEELYMAILSRPPTAAELERFTAYLDTDDKGRQRGLWGEAIWTLLTCSEFRFNH